MKKIILLISIMSLYLNSHSQQNWFCIDGGGEFSIGIKADSTLWTWGNNNNGQLGNNLATTSDSLPIVIDSNSKWKMAVAGGSHALAIKNDGTLWAWGYNVYGQLGVGNTLNRNIPTQIGVDNDWKFIDAGQGHSMAIKVNGTLWAWGYNIHGQLGIGTLTNSSIPVQITRYIDWKTVSCGKLHTAALRGDGFLWTWGLNSNGQLGDSTTMNKPTPIKIGDDRDWIMVSCGLDFNLALKTDSSLYSWGINTNGQLGDSTTAQVITPQEIGTSNKWSSISAGSSFSFAIQENGTLWSWGRNHLGQLGQGNVIQTNYPKQAGTSSAWKYISASDGHITSTGTVLGYHFLGVKNSITGFCYTGANYMGQGGHGTLVNQSSIYCSPITGIKDVNVDIINITIYPNPTSHYLTLEMDELELSNISFKLINALGQTVVNKEVNSYKTEINMMSLPKGLYTLVLFKNNNVIATNRVVKI